MTPVERALFRLRPAIGERLVERIRSNLPSRKPQLWEGFFSSVVNRARHAAQSRLDPEWPKRKVVRRLKHSNLRMELSPENRDIDLPVLQFGVYEISGTRFIQAFLRSGMNFVDVGANSGYYSLLASRMVGPTGLVYAMEPADVPFAKLLRNIELNGLQNVKADQAAAGLTAGRAVLHTSAVRRNDGLGSLAPGPGRKDAGPEVQVTSLTMVASELPEGKADLVKVDVEGTELDVLSGGKELLESANAPALLFESFSIPQVVSFLTPLGYEVRQLHFSLARGLEFPKVGEPFDNSFATYEPPNFVALKSPNPERSFLTLTARSKRAIRPGLRFLAWLA